jgi:hypothetical protein
LIVGEDIEFNAEDPGYGYRSENSGQAVDAYFNLDATVADWYFGAEVWIEGEASDNALMIIQRFNGSDWVNFTQQYSWNDIPAQAWTAIEALVDDDPLNQTGAFRVHLSIQGFHNFIRFRKVILQDVSE